MFKLRIMCDVQTSRNQELFCKNSTFSENAAIISKKLHQQEPRVSVQTIPNRIQTAMQKASKQPLIFLIFKLKTVKIHSIFNKSQNPVFQ